MAQGDPRRDDFINKLPSFFRAGESYIIYVPKSISASTLQKYAKSQKIALWFGPEEIDYFKKSTYLVSFALVGIFWIFLRKPQAFFSLFALLLGLVFIQISPEIYYALVTVFFSYAILLDNWSRHYLQVRSQASPLLKTFQHTILSWIIFFCTYGVMFTLLKMNFAGIFLLSLYFSLLLVSCLIWIFWVKSRKDNNQYVSFFPSNIVQKNLNLYTSHGFFYLGALTVGAIPFVILSLLPTPPQAREYIQAREALYPEIERTSLLILYRTTSDYPNLASYLSHRFYQQTIPLIYSQSYSFPPENQTITQKVYSFEGVEFMEEKEQVLISLSDEWIQREVEEMPLFWRILISPHQKLLTFETSTKPASLFTSFEKQLIWISLSFFLIFSLKLKSYFRIMNSV
jgi:hypothetical protein